MALCGRGQTGDVTDRPEDFPGTEDWRVETADADDLGGRRLFSFGFLSSAFRPLEDVSQGLLIIISLPSCMSSLSLFFVFCEYFFYIFGLRLPGNSFPSKVKLVLFDHKRKFAFISQQLHGFLVVAGVLATRSAAIVKINLITTRINKAIKWQTSCYGGN